MALIKAQCTNCGAALEVEQDKDAAICPYCNTPYVVEKAVNQYQTKIIADGATINVLCVDPQIVDMIEEANKGTRETGIEKTREENAYNRAIALMQKDTYEGYNEALKILKDISPWSNSQKLIEECISALSQFEQHEHTRKAVAIILLLAFLIVTILCITNGLN